MVIIRKDKYLITSKKVYCKKKIDFHSKQINRNKYDHSPNKIKSVYIKTTKRQTGEVETCFFFKIKSVFEKHCLVQVILTPLSSTVRLHI